MIFYFIAIPEQCNYFYCEIQKKRNFFMKQRVLVIGFGFMGQTHAGNLLKNPNAELAGIVDPCDPAERLRTIKGNKATVTITPESVAGVPHYHDMDEALRGCGADAAVIALPTKLHYGSVMKALECGCHVMVEKPFSIDCAECESMIRKAAEQKRILAVGYVVRHMREYEMLRETVKSNRLGRLRYMSLSRYTGIPAWGNWNDPEFIKASGGALFDLVSHDIDFARYCLGEPDSITPDPVLCREMNGNLIAAVLHYPGNNVFVEGGFVTPSHFPFRRNYTAYFENGTLVSDAPGDFKEIVAGGEIRVEDYSHCDPYYTEMDRFLQAIVTGDDAGLCTGEDAMRSICCCHGILSRLNVVEQPGKFQGADL